MGSFQPPSSPTPARRHAPQLDALRALAVVAVLVEHLIDGRHLPELLRGVPFGFLGVRLFFVMSSYLITGILLRPNPAETRARFLGRFWAHRAVRIFPLYYLVVGLAVALDVSSAREQALPLLTHTYNLYLSRLGWFPETFSHFWFLSVQVQFYAFWPLAMLHLPPRALGPFVVAFALLGPAYRAFALASDWNGVALYVFTPSSFDALGAGALLALLGRDDARRARLRRALRWVVLPAGLLAMAILSTIADATVHAVAFDTATAAVCAWLVAEADAGIRGIPGRVLSWGPLLYLGRISYGIYVIHLLVPLMEGAAASALGLPAPGRDVAGFLLASALSVAFAALSWHCFEQPIARRARGRILRA